MMMTWQPDLDELAQRETLAKRMGGEDKVKRQHEAGRLTIINPLAGSLRDMPGLPPGRHRFENQIRLRLP
jgi:hypothetical protein